MALQQRMKAIPVEAQLLDRIKALKAEVEHLTSENLLVREEADRYCRLWQEAKEGKV
jgi:post-segregation antitoxin (ccd killing protein)